jgi:hypothetical protein
MKRGMNSTGILKIIFSIFSRMRKKGLKSWGSTKREPSEQRLIIPMDHKTGNWFAARACNSSDGVGKSGESQIPKGT